jgi:hypothetical protein
MLPTNYPTEYFAVKWMGMLLAPTTETYRLSIEAQNTSMVELIINGARKLVYNDYTGQGTTEEMYVDLEFTKGTFYDFELRYAQKIGPHKLRLFWESDTLDR